MKKLILVLILSFFSLPVFAGGISYGQIKETVTEYNPVKKICAPTPDTPFQDIERADLDIDLRVNLLDNPGDARYDIYLMDNWDIQVTINMTSSFYAYTWLGTRKYKKEKVADAVYNESWDSRMLFAGVGLYITPVLKVFGGAGRVFLDMDGDKPVYTDADGNDLPAAEDPSMGVSVEYGMAYDIAYGSNKIVLGFKIVQVQLDKEEATAAELQGNPSHTTFSIAYSIPLMR